MSGPVAITKGKPGGRKAFNSALILDLGSFVLRFKGAPLGRRSDPLRVPLIQIPQLPGAGPEAQPKAASAAKAALQRATERTLT